MPTASRLNGTAMASVAAGAILLYGGITGRSPLLQLRALVSGQSPASVAQSQGIAGQDSSGAASPAPGSGSGPAINPSQLQQYAFSLFAQYGWGTDQQAPLVHLWNQESGWRWDAKNPSSGAYGIPQALPASKMVSAGGDWQTNPQTQIKWGLQYIKSTYGSPAAAWAHEQANNWY